MFEVPEYIESMSVNLSKVLSDIGVNERIVQKRRRAELLAESLLTLSYQLQNYNITAYHFGSQSEGTTTHGLKSDTDILLCENRLNVIQDECDWKSGEQNCLMVQNNTVSPGYCLLRNMPNRYFVSEEKGGTPLRKNHVIFDIYDSTPFEGTRNGPARTINRGGMTIDYVFANHCKSWPLQAQQWLDWQGVGQWPSADMKRYCASTGCFLVSVGSKGSEQEEHEWRISTSMAERCLMFSLNITQIRCYVMMKIIITTFIKPYFEDTISSFMCKTVLFHCIANTHSNIWRENNILGCLSVCLSILHNCIMNENCPHFIIPGNNLMKGNIPHKDKHNILQTLCDVVADRCKALLEIKCDDLGLRLKLKMKKIHSPKTSDLISGNIIYNTGFSIHLTITHCFLYICSSNDEEAAQTLRKYIHKLDDIYNHCEGVNKTACQLFKQRFCTSLGTALASCSIRLHNIVSTRALTWIFLGLNTDVSSGKLKLASIYNCTGDFQKTEITLMDIERNYDANNVEPVCSCSDISSDLRDGFYVISNDHDEEAVQYIIATCVTFLPYEIQFVPHELQCDMFKSKKEAYTPPEDQVLKFAVVDSLPYLYFLQYKIYKNLGRQEDKKRALSNLLKTTAYEPNLGHRETALNILGQCMEQEGRATDALHCYVISLNLREKYNVARIHICRLLSRLITDKKRWGKAYCFACKQDHVQKF